jgi:hypothetical protein
MWWLRPVCRIRWELGKPGRAFWPESADQARVRQKVRNRWDDRPADSPPTICGSLDVGVGAALPSGLGVEILDVPQFVWVNDTFRGSSPLRSVPALRLIGRAGFARLGGRRPSRQTGFDRIPRKGTRMWDMLAAGGSKTRDKRFSYNAHVTAKSTTANL